MDQLTDFMLRAVRAEGEAALERIRAEVETMARRFPVPGVTELSTAR